MDRQRDAPRGLPAAATSAAASAALGATFVRAGVPKRVRRLRDARDEHATDRRDPRAATASPTREARRVAVLRRGRRPGHRRGRDRARGGGAAATLGVARLGDDQVLVARRPTARARRGRPRPHVVAGSTAVPARRVRTTPPPTCSTRRSASAWASTSARPAPRCAPTSSASTSPTRRAHDGASAREVEAASTSGSSQPPRPRITRPIDEARALGADGLFGEKYGEIVRVVEVRRVLAASSAAGPTCATTAEIGLFEIVAETRSRPDVRRVEAITGPVAVDFLRERDATLDASPRPRRSRPTRSSSGSRELRDRRRPAAAPRPRRRRRGRAGRRGDRARAGVGGGAPARSWSRASRASRRRTCPRSPTACKGRLGAPGVVVLGVAVGGQGRADRRRRPGDRRARREGRRRRQGGRGRSSAAGAAASRRWRRPAARTRRRPTTRCAPRTTRSPRRSGAERARPAGEVAGGELGQPPRSSVRLPRHAVERTEEPPGGRA